MKKLELHHRILIGMVIGAAVGIAMKLTLDPDTAVFESTVWWMDLLGKDLFIGALKMIIAPLILASIVTGISTLPSAGDLGNIGFRTVGYYMFTTTIAVCIGIAMVTLMRPGYTDAAKSLRDQRELVLQDIRSEFELASSGDNSQDSELAFQAYIAAEEGQNISGSEFGGNWQHMQSVQDMGPAQLLRDQLLMPILSNPFSALAASPPNTLGIIAFAILIGLACLVLGEPAAPVKAFFHAFNDVMMTITHWVMQISPLAIGCIIASLLATLGIDALRALGYYFLVVLAALTTHFCVLLVLVRVLGGMSPWTFLRGMRAPMLIAFTTASSTATLPINLDALKRKLGVSEKVTDFSLPVGATVNMDGSALYEAVAILFLVQVYGGLADVPVVLSFSTTILIAVTAVVTSIGVAAVPSAALITMVLIANAIGLPMYYIPIIYAVDHILDMFRTTVNITGDATGAVIVDRWRDRENE